MKSVSFYLLLVLSAISWCMPPLACQMPTGKPAGLKDRIARLESTRDRLAYDSLHLLLMEHYLDLSATERGSLRQTLRQYARWPFEIICPETEPGTRIAIQGKILDESDRPVPNAKIHLFQTDHRGYYSPTDSASGKMAEQDPRLEGFLTTDSTGSYTVNTIRPANYPIKYKDRTIPAHIHFVIHAPGFRERALQMVFADDPAMTAYWLDWAAQSNYPVVRVDTTTTPQRASVDLKLLRK